MVQNNDKVIPVVKQIEKIYDRIDSVKDLSYKVNIQHKYDYYECLRMLTEKRMQLEGKLQELKYSSVDTYDEIISAVEIKVSELNIVIHQINERFYQ
ncbi:MAG: hypothetical protein M3512_12385 [Bacteroidota bacterium]|nr:hypothetical protein [Bacteroidota bacterium]